MVPLYDDFKPIDYLYQFYSKENKENKFLLKFFIDSAFFLKNYWGKEKKNIIDISGGPSLFSITPFSSLAKSISFSDYLKINLDLIQNWIHKKEFFNWDPVIEATIQIEKTIYENTTNNEEILPKLIDERKASIRRKWNQTLQIDLKSLNVPIQQFDLVLNNFVAECITTNTDEFLFVLQNILNYVKPKGFILFSFFLEAKYLRVGSLEYPTYFLTYEYITKILEHYNLKIIKFERMNSIFHYGYNEILCILVQNCQKPNCVVISHQEQLVYLFNFLFKKFKEKNIYFSGTLSKDLFLKFMYFKIFYHIGHDFYNTIIYNNFKIIFDNFHIFIPFDLLSMINSYKELFNFDGEFYNLNIIKNKSYYFKRVIKYYLETYKEVQFSNDLILLPLNNKITDEDWSKIRILLQENFSERYFILKNIIYIPIFELKNIVDIIKLKKTIESIKRRDYLININHTIKSKILLKFKNINKILLFNDIIIDMNFQRFSEEDFSEKIEHIRFITF